MIISSKIELFLAGRPRKFRRKAREAAENFTTTVVNMNRSAKLRPSRVFDKNVLDTNKFCNIRSEGCVSNKIIKRRKNIPGNRHVFDFSCLYKLVARDANLHPSPTPDSAQLDPLTLKPVPNGPKQSPFTFPKGVGTPSKGLLDEWDGPSSS